MNSLVIPCREAARDLLFALLLVALPVGAAHAQKDATAFGFFIENDTFHPQKSDTGYTNGIRLAWSINRYRPGMRYFTEYNVAQIFRLPILNKLGLLPKRLDGNGCEFEPERGKRKISTYAPPPPRPPMPTGGACTILNLGVAQVMYTPDSLMSTLVEVHQRPYAGFLWANAGVTTLDSPSTTDPNHWLSFTEISNQFLLGITGQGAHAEDTQSLAHWVWATGAHRPMGWGNQLRQQVQVGTMSDIQFRPRRFFEYCNGPAGCTGLQGEKRWLDFTPHLETILGTHMVRVSEGITARIGARFSDAVGALRIPTTKGTGGGGRKCHIYPVCERFWYYGFANAETRQVPYNMFISGGLADGGPTGWRTIRQIETRHFVHELSTGAAIGNTRFTGRFQLAWRTAEYDVIGRGRTNGWHGYGSLFVAVHTQPD